MKFRGQTSYNHKNSHLKQGVLIANLGTPPAPTARALRRYLKQFLSDPRVVEIPRLLWWLVLNLIILRIRPAKSAKLYDNVWTERGSPLYKISCDQRDALRTALAEYNVPIELGMRYGQPSIGSAIDELQAQNVDDIIVLPLYPQYCAATTASTFDAIAAKFTRQRWLPSLRFINGYHKNSGYINALVAFIVEHVERHGLPDRLLFSYHGIPQRNLDLGDPYYCFCMQTTRLVVEALPNSLSALAENIDTAFQSRFGKAKWLQPYTEATLIHYAESGVSNVAVICPGFSADCLETIDEIGREAKAVFIEAGGQSLQLIPCLNDSDIHIQALADIVRAELKTNA